MLYFAVVWCGNCAAAVFIIKMTSFFVVASKCKRLYAKWYQPQLLSCLGIMIMFPAGLQGVWTSVSVLPWKKILPISKINASVRNWRQKWYKNLIDLRSYDIFCAFVNILTNVILICMNDHIGQKPKLTWAIKINEE